MSYSDIRKKYLGNATEEESKKKKSNLSYSDIASKYGLKSDIDQDYINSFISDANKFLSSAEDDYKNVGWGNASSSFESRNTAYSDLSERSRTVQRWLEANKNNLGKDTYINLRDTLREIDRGTQSVNSTFKRANEFYSSFETEQAANKWIEDQKQQEEYRSVLGAEDFGEKSDYVSTVDYSLFGKPKFGDPIYEYINNQTIEDKRLLGVGEDSARAFINSDHSIYSMDNSFDDDESLFEKKGYDYIKDEEIAIYNYYYNTQGKEKAEEYLKSIESDLAQRKAEKIVEKVDGSALELLFSVRAGLDSFASGLKNIDNYLMGKEADTLSAIQYAQSEMSSNNEGIWKVANDAFNTTSNQLPSILVGMFTGSVGGLATMSISAGGNAYAEMRYQGYEDWQAAGYATLVMASEALLGKFLGGFSSLGGKHSLSAVTKNLVSGIDNAFARLAIQVPLNMASEGLEESLQTVIEPAFKALMTGEEYEAAEWSDIIYSGLLGAISAGMIEGIPGTIGAINESRNASNNKRIYGDNLNDLFVETAEIGGMNTAKLDGLIDKYGKKGDLSKWDIQRLINANEEALLSQDKGKIKVKAEEMLAKYGETNDIDKVADVITKIRSGEEISKAERDILTNSTYGRRVSTELNPDIIEAGTHNTAWTEDIGTERINADIYNRDSDKNTPQPVENPKTNIMPPDGEEKEREAEIEAPADISEVTTEITDNVSVENLSVTDSVGSVEVEEGTANLEDVSKKYGAQAQAMIHTYVEGQNVAKYDKDYQLAYDMGKSGVSLSYALNSDTISYITENQVKLAYEAGKAASDTSAKELDAKNKKAATGKTGRKKGTVQGIDVKIEDLKKNFNDRQNIAYKTLVTIAEVTGYDIVLYKSEANIDGDFEGSQGKFKWSDNKIYIDINAGLKNVKSINELAKFAMLRTFSHEFTHSVEKWNPIGYNELRKVVFEELTARGEDVHALVEEKRAITGLDYDKASREVVAEALTDILPDSHFVETLANKHKNIFQKLLENLKEFLADIKAYFKTIVGNPSKEANALKEQVGDAVRYVERIVEIFDKVAVEAVENYQATVATDNINNTDGGIINVAERTERKETDNGRNKGTVSENSGRTRETNENRSGIQSAVGETQEGTREESSLDRGEQNLLGLKQKTVKNLQNPDNHIAPDKNSLLHTLQETSVKEYGIECYIIKKEAWLTEYFKDSPACSFGGKIYVKENLDAEDASDIIPHEATHIMLQLKFKPYMDFLESTPEMLNFKSEKIEDLIKTIEEHLGISFLDMTETQQNRFYDELNAFVYGLYEGGVFSDSEYDYGEWIPSVFNDFEAYANELSEIHKKFKAERKGVGEYSDVYDLLKNAINNVTRYEKGGFLFRIYKNGDTWQGHIDKVNQSEGGYPVSDARGIHYKSEIFTNRQDAVEDIIAVARNNKLLEVKAEEVKPNGENVDNRETVQQSDTDRQEDSHVLEGLQAENVQGDVQGRDSVGDSVERGQETGQNDVDADNGTGTSGRSGVGDSESGDIRRDDELTPEAAEKLHEEVTEQIAQQSTEKPKGRNFVIGDTLDLPNGEKARYKANIEAIRLVKQLETEGRYATEAEQVILSKYVGWGGLANAFDERKADWSKEYKELKELLSDEEYSLARGSTLNAHYTDISVIKAMYDGLNQLGFNGGRMMEPSSGVGNFVGAMPAEMSAKVKSWTMVELDGITGLIAKYLYPNADVRIQGFEKANIPNNYMDVIISNVPFGNYPITDKAYPKKVTSAIHNYFFAKSLDKVRPGGIVMFITSSYTMNSKDETVRRYIMQRADLLGAIRLPDTAFKGNAGTEVVTDILILKKRVANTAYTGEDFLAAPYKYINGYNGANINSYFDTHPEMVLGTATMDGSMYRGGSLTYKALEGKGTLADQIRTAFKSIKGKMDYPAQLSPEKTNFAVEKAGKKTKNDGYVAKDGKIYQNKDGELVEQSVTPKVAERIKGMLDIRDAAKALMNAQQQGLKETEIKKARVNLNKLYDSFVKKNGFLNAPSNRSAFNGDPDRYSVFALENWDSDKKTATKADIFSKNTISPNRTVTSAKDVSEGLIVSVNQTGGVDVPLIAALVGKSVPDVTRELLDSRKAFKNRDGVLETAETYLSGNVRAKLRDAEALVPMDSDYQKNVEALKAVMPEDVSYQDIFVNPGTPWIPSNVYSDFAAYMLGTRNTEWSQAIDVTRNADTGNFTVELKNAYLKHNAQNTQKWGTPRRSFLDLFDAMLNSKSVVIKDKLEDGSSVINKDATAAANEKIENITKEFQEWLWKDEARRTELATLYNEVFNSIVTPKYNGDNLTVNGANALKPLRPHQRNAVQRIISSGGNTLLAHKVGAGKTYEMAAAAMKLKELGLVKKPMFAVPKSLVAQWGTEFIDFFPTAKLLVAEATDFTPANRKVFMNRVANGNYDAVIVSYEQFEKLPVSDDFTRELYQEQINSVIAAIEEAKADKGGKSLSVKDLEKKRKSLQAKIDKLTDKAKDEDNIDFEQLGVDSLFIDEAHNFKNLFYTTSMTNVAGLGNKDGSKRAFDLYTKVRYLQKLNGGKGIVFATATPVMNSMSEMYIMQKYLQPDLLEQLGLNTFDAWAKQFGEVVNGVEIKPSGQGYRVKQSFSRFKNMSELQLLFRNFADVLTDIPGLKIPKMKGGAVNVVVCEPGQFQQDYMKELEKRADNIKNVDPSVDNMLKITSDGRKISYTQRMIDPSLPYEDGCKIYRCADNVIEKYKESKDIKGTQIIFLDMATPKGKSKTETTEEDDAGMDMESARLYDDLKARLVQNGIPSKEIAFIHEADTDQKKKKLFADVNEGKVRVLIGSTGKMGVGMNAQKRIVAIHHLDAPWRPGDVEQRNGRAFRQGNINEEVENFTYVTEGSFDARLWDILERKQNFINQVMNGESVGRETEDTGEVTLSAAEVKALASGSPLIMEQVQLDTDIKKLESLYRAHQSSVRAAKERLSKDKGTIELLERMIELGKTDMLATVDTYSEGKFSITVGKQKFTEKKDAGVALMAEATAKAVDTGYTTIGSFAGFDVKVIKTSEGIKGIIAGKQGYPFNTYPNNTTFMINHVISVVEGITEKVNMWNTQLTETKKDMAEQEKLIAEPFAKQTELDEKRKRYNEVMEILNPKEEQALDSADEDTVQEQSRDYLSDSEYMEAVKSSDMKTAQKMVDEAAKEAGYDSDKLYHGTYSGFGFTKIDLSKSDDGISFFATDSIETARTYSGKDGVKNISERPSDLSSLKEAYDSKVNALIDLLKTATGNSIFINSRNNHFGEFISSLEDGNDTYDRVSKEFNEYINELIRSMPDHASINGKRVTEKELQKVRDASAELQDILKDVSTHRENSAGNYQLYAKTEGLFEIDAEGNFWAEIPFEKYDENYPIATTREIASYAKEKGYKGVIIKNVFDDGGKSFIQQKDPSTVYIFFDPQNQVKSADPVTYDDNGKVIPLSERFNAEDSDIRHQQRSEGLTDREVLELAANEVQVSDLSQSENDALTIFQDRLANLKDLQEKRAEQGRLYKEQQFGAKPDRAEASKTLNRMQILDEQIKKATADVLSVEEKEVLKRVLNKARKVVELKERQHGQEILNRWRDRRNNADAIKKYRDRLRGDVDELTNWIIGPNNKDIAKHVPDVLKNSVIPFLSSINFMSKRSLKGGNATVSDKEFIKRLNALQLAIKANIDVYGMYSGYNDLPSDFIEKLEHFISTANVLLEKSAGEFIINQMTSDEIKELSKIVRTLKKYIMQLNRFHNNAMYQHVYEAGDNSIDFLKELDNAGAHTGGLSNFVFWQQIRPAYAFERFGEGGKAIYDGLREGQAKLAFNAKEIEKFSANAYTAKEVKAWENEYKSFTLGKDLVKIPISHIMSFYELTKDPEALEHINGQGIRVATYTHKGKKISDVGHILTVGEFNQIVSSLTDRQKEVANNLQKFMAVQGGKWGNYVSVARFGEELFTNPNYFPINSDGRHLSATTDEHPSAAALYALLNMSFTKSRKEGANNRIVLYSIFDVFANHMASMAQYNAMALPILDALKWFNYQQVFVDDLGNKTVIASVREQLDRVYGVPDETRPGSGKQGYAETFIVNIIKSFNGTAAQGTPYDTLGLKSLHTYNIAQVAYNLRVVVQQPLAITRAGMLLSYRSILKGLKLKPSKIRQNIEEMQKYSGIAAWKSLGFYDVNISRGLTHLIKHDSGVFEKISNVGMWGAEKADTLTWAAIWSAAKEEVTRTQHLTPQSEGFYEAVTKLFEDVIYKTQVVDSILTKNEFMRDKGTFSRLVGSFMSEATTNASMVIDAIDKYNLDMKRGMSKRDAWQKNKHIIGRTLYVFGIGAVLLAAVQAVIDADRDDDEYEEYYEKWLEAFGGNLVDELMPFNKLPIISDFYDLAKSLLSAVGVDTYGNPPSSVFMQWYDSLVKGTEIIYDKISGEDTNYTWYGGIYKLLQAVSGMSGLPLGSATREIITIWNNIAGVMAPSLKVKTYESSELSQIKYAYEDGYLTYEEAVELLLEKGLADNENEAYFIVQGWEAGEGYSKYDAIYDVVLNGGDFNAAMDELTSHGYSEKEVLSQVKSKIGEWYQKGEISKAQATSMLTKYFDMDSDEITATVNKWSSYVVTGIKYEDIDDKFIEGDITASRAIEMYVRYGSMTREKATEKVTVLEFVKENPSAEDISYSAVTAYKQYCEPYGVPVDTYYDAWKHKNTLSGTVKESMMSYINSQSLSAKQKDSLYFAFGWAESKLYEAPWH